MQVQTNQQKPTRSFLANIVLANINSGDRDRIENGVIQARQMLARAKSGVEKAEAEELLQESVFSKELFRMLSSD